MSKNLSMHYQNSQFNRVMQLKYKSKYRRLKRRIKTFVLENAALCDEVADMQAELSIAREERRFLIKRLMRHEGFENWERLEEEEVAAQLEAKAMQLPKKRGPKKRLSATTGNNVATPVTAGSEKSDKSRVKVRDRICFDAEGKPVYPINLGNILIHSPGEILPVNPNFHNAHWIYPVGYVATRIYAHPKEPQRKCVYTCKILNNAGIPQFQVIPDNDLDSVFFGDTANSCHQVLLETLQRSLSDCIKQPLQVQGERFFGLGNSTVKMLLQMDTGLSQCATFNGFQQLEDAGANFPALPDEQDPSLSFDALQSLIAMATYHSMPEVKDEPPDELFDFK